jgi:hypothetical protein
VIGFSKMNTLWWTPERGNSKRISNFCYIQQRKKILFYNKPLAGGYNKTFMIIFTTGNRAIFGGHKPPKMRGNLPKIGYFQR